MFVAGSLMALNFTVQRPSGLIGWTSASESVRFRIVYGWPYQCVWSGDILINGKVQSHYFEEVMMLLDFYFALAGLIAVRFGCEWWIRRRAL
jgi:hypothetical protein